MLNLQIREKVKLAPYTTFKVGGVSEFLAEPESKTELVEAFQFAKKHSLLVSIIGRGSNILVSDTGVRGLTLVLRNFENGVQEDKTADGETVLLAGAGVSLPKLSREAANAGFTGYEFFIGIPGTVGGAIVMNAGYGPGDLNDTAHRCLEVEFWTAEKGFLRKPYADFHPSYRRTDFQTMQAAGECVIITGASFQLRDIADRSHIRRETARHLAMRKEKQPLTRPTAGSVFRAAADGTPAAVWIDRAGLKGLRVGGACVSEKHANWIENCGGASAKDILSLIEDIQTHVQKQFGVVIEPEVLRIGEF